MAGGVLFVGFLVWGQSWTSISSSIGLDWIVGYEPLSFPFFLGGMLVPVKILLDRFSRNSGLVFAGFSSWVDFMSSLGRFIRLCGYFAGDFGVKRGVYWFLEFHLEMLLSIAR